MRLLDPSGGYSYVRRAGKSLGTLLEYQIGTI